MSEITTKQAVQRLIKSLKDDESYRFTWQANIAIQFQDEFYKNHRTMGVHEISNRAAKNFLELLVNQPSGKE